jgi:hypothetical protein
LYFSGCYSGDQVKKDEVGGACGTHGWDGECIQEFGGEMWNIENT